jgi:hypothetical protein
MNVTGNPITHHTEKLAPTDGHGAIDQTFCSEEKKWNLCFWSGHLTASFDKPFQTLGEFVPGELAPGEFAPGDFAPQRRFRPRRFRPLGLKPEISPPVVFILHNFPRFWCIIYCLNVYFLNFAWCNSGKEQFVELLISTIAWIIAWMFWAENEWSNFWGGTGVDVMITIFGDFGQKIGVFLKNECYDCHKFTAKMHSWIGSDGTLGGHWPADWTGMNVSICWLSQIYGICCFYLQAF